MINGTRNKKQPISFGKPGQKNTIKTTNKPGGKTQLKTNNLLTKHHSKTRC